jgi:hypothetical protein
MARWLDVERVENRFITAELALRRLPQSRHATLTAQRRFCAAMFRPHANVISPGFSGVNSTVAGTLRRQFPPPDIQRREHNRAAGAIHGRRSPPRAHIADTVRRPGDNRASAACP